MNKVEALRVTIHDNGSVSVSEFGHSCSIAAHQKPALLAALLENAGAVKVEITNYLEWDDAGNPLVKIRGDKWLPVCGQHWLLPVPEDTEELEDEVCPNCGLVYCGHSGHCEA